MTVSSVQSAECVRLKPPLALNPCLFQLQPAAKPGRVQRLQGRLVHRAIGFMHPFGQATRDLACCRDSAKLSRLYVNGSTFSREEIDLGDASHTFLTCLYTFPP